jgi:DNA modification methylase
MSTQHNTLQNEEIIAQIFTLFEENFKNSLNKAKNDLEVIGNNMTGYVDLFKKLSVKTSVKKPSKSKRAPAKKKPVIEAVSPVTEPIKITQEKPVKAKRPYVRKPVAPVTQVVETITAEEKPVKVKRPYVRKAKPVAKLAIIDQPIDAQQPTMLESFENNIVESKEVATNEPIFEEEKIKATIDLKNIDSLNGMKSLPDGCIDLVLSDPPYGIASKNKLTMKKNKLISTMEAWGNDFQDAWSNVEEYWEWFKPFVSEMVRVMKDGASMILFLDRKYIGLITHYIEKEFKLNFKNNLYFVKNNPTPSFYKNQYRSNMETAIWFSKGSAKTFNFGDQKDMKQTFIGNLGKKFFLDGESHPTEKYGFMIEPLITNHSKEGQTVLDPFSGSGTTLIHAKRQNRNAIGFELNEKFYKIAKARAENEDAVKLTA